MVLEDWADGNVAQTACYAPVGRVVEERVTRRSWAREGANGDGWDGFRRFRGLLRSFSEGTPRFSVEQTVAAEECPRRWSSPPSTRSKRHNCSPGFLRRTGVTKNALNSRPDCVRGHSRGRADLVRRMALLLLFFLPQPRPCPHTTPFLAARPDRRRHPTRHTRDTRRRCVLDTPPPFIARFG